MHFKHTRKDEMCVYINTAALACSSPAFWVSSTEEKLLLMVKNMEGRGESTTLNFSMV